MFRRLPGPVDKTVHLRGQEEGGQIAVFPGPLIQKLLHRIHNGPDRHLEEELIVVSSF